jgi:heptosyltransferase-1
VVRLGAMGDILHALPAVTALRQAHPGWIIDWVVEPRWRALLASDASAGRETRLNWAKPNLAQPIVDRLHLAPTKQWRRSPASRDTLHQIQELRHALKAAEYDTVIDLQGAMRSALIGRMTGCRRLIGEADPRERPARWLFTEQVETHGEHVIEQGVELASAIAGDDLKPVAPWLPIDEAAEAWADGILSAARQAGKATILINPGAGWGAKRWPEERYAAVVMNLMDRGLNVLVNSGPGEEALAQAVVGSTGKAKVVNCSLEELIALTRRVALVIAGDTGPLHLGCALGRPVVGIYGPTDPHRNGPFGTRFRVLRSAQSRRDHTRHKEPEAGLLAIAPQNVLEAAEDLLAEPDVQRVPA